LFTVNLFLLTLWSTPDFTVTFWDDWEKMCNEKDQNFGATTTGSFIMMCLPTCPSKPLSLYQYGYRPPSSLLAGLSTPWFRSVSQIENESEGMTFWNSVWHLKGITSGTRQH
jgi:hypothetical protein